MRKWWQGKKQRVAERIIKKVEQELLKDLSLMKGDEDQVDTSSASPNTDEISSKAEQIADPQITEEMDLILEKIMQKGEMLIMMQVPHSTRLSHKTGKQGGLLLIQEKSVDEAGKDLELREKMKLWKKMLNSQGAIKSFTERKQEIFDSAVMSILACLQTSIQVDKIWNKVELTIQKGFKRVTGLNLLSQLMSI